MKKISLGSRQLERSREAHGAQLPYAYLEFKRNSLQLFDGGKILIEEGKRECELFDQTNCCSSEEYGRAELPVLGERSG